MPAILRIFDDPGMPTISVLVDVGNLSTMVVVIPRAIFGTPAADAAIDAAVAGARAPEAVQYAQRRRGGERS
jgi:hypothetical protein